MQLHKIARICSLDIGAVFVFVWTLGLTFGIYLGRTLCGSLGAMLYSSCFSGSMFLVPSAVLPISLVWIANKGRLPGLIFPIIFCKAFMDGLLFPGIGAAFSSAAWLMGVLLFFSDRLATVFLIYYAAQCLLTRSHNNNRLFAVFVLLITATMAVDYFLISDIFVTLMS